MGRFGKLLVGSIFPDNSPASRKWLGLQLKYFQATTAAEFTHISVIQEGDPKAFSQNTETFLNGKGGTGSLAHLRGLKCLKAEFLKRQDSYDHFLFIDMDAFPIRNRWDQLLIDRLASRWDIAALLRTENLEQRLHSSVLFCRKIGLSRVDWEICDIGPDLMGGRENDLKILHYQDELRDRAFPLLKSNKHLVHPLLCSVYWDMFYHHSCGSARRFRMRGAQYWGHIMPKDTNVQEFTKELMSNPNVFVKKLIGWKEEHVHV